MDFSIVSSKAMNTGEKTFRTFKFTIHFKITQYLPQSLVDRGANSGNRPSGVVDQYTVRLAMLKVPSDSVKVIFFSDSHPRYDWPTTLAIRRFQYDWLKHDIIICSRSRISQIIHLLAAQWKVQDLLQYSDGA